MQGGRDGTNGMRRPDASASSLNLNSWEKKLETRGPSIANPGEAKRETQRGQRGRPRICNCTRGVKLDEPGVGENPAAAAKQPQTIRTTRRNTTTNEDNQNRRIAPSPHEHSPQRNTTGAAPALAPPPTTATPTSPNPQDSALLVPLTVGQDAHGRKGGVLVLPLPSGKTLLHQTATHRDGCSRPQSLRDPLQCLRSHLKEEKEREKNNRAIIGSDHF